LIALADIATGPVCRSMLVFSLNRFLVIVFASPSGIPASLAGAVHASVSAIFPESALVLLVVAGCSSVRLASLYGVLAFLMRARAFFALGPALLLVVSGRH
jgi:hypothetical protein